MGLGFLVALGITAASLIALKYSGGDKIVDWIMAFISNIMQGRILPQPIAFAFFIFLISNLVFVFPLIFNMVGFHCSTDRVMYNIPFVNFISNIDFAFKEFQLRETKSTNPSIRNYTTVEGSGVVGSGKCANHTLVLCTNCTPNDPTLGGHLFQTPTWECASNGYNNAPTALHYIFMPECWNGCHPVLGEYYDYQQDVFVCYNSTRCNISNNINQIDLDLSSAGRVVPTSQKGDISNFIGIGCFKYSRKENDLTYAPQLALFGKVPIFSQEIWTLIAVMMVIVGIGSLIRR